MTSTSIVPKGVLASLGKLDDQLRELAERPFCDCFEQHSQAVQLLSKAVALEALLAIRARARGELRSDKKLEQVKQAMARLLEDEQKYHASEAKKKTTSTTSAAPAASAPPTKKQRRN